MKITRVSITGADESVSPQDLASLSREFPFVEWGILFCASLQGKRAGYPGTDWLARLSREGQTSPMNLAAHLCGNWARIPAKEGRMSFPQEWAALWKQFQRAQLNFGWRYRNQVVSERLSQALKQAPGKTYIIQISQGRDADLLSFLQQEGHDALPLFDRSHALFRHSGADGALARDRTDAVRRGGGHGFFCAGVEVLSKAPRGGIKSIQGSLSA